ncbi:hypothetical protein ACPWSR_03610 [Alloiococcus sp. CFN-8]|uniref:hypothetical protein n=1 Tax=Alloiococcus sp. CFN-8 TaxID=3416081 RepID=UPI003CFB4C4B
MEGYKFPFPDKALALKELSYDPCYKKIDEQAIEAITERAWNTGEEAAEGIFKRFNGESDFWKIIAKSKLQCFRIDKDYVVGNQRYFSDYLSGQGVINLYTKSVSLWAKENSLTQEEAENLILSHEYYHYLECNEIGLTSKQYQVPMISIGKLKLGHTGIRALSEIGAHAFARKYYEMVRMNLCDTIMK